jgi:molybdopterin-guanine dinucleotide biosynthesis protein
MRHPPLVCDHRLCDTRRHRQQAARLTVLTSRVPAARGTEEMDAIEGGMRHPPLVCDHRLCDTRRHRQQAARLTVLTSRVPTARGTEEMDAIEGRDAASAPRL